MIAKVNYVDLAQIFGFLCVPFGVAVGALLWRVGQQSQRIDALESGLLYIRTIDDAWSEFVACVSDNVTTLSVRQDWHTAILDRLVLPDGTAIDGRAVIASDTVLANDIRRRLLELDLFRMDSASRRSAARGLADGVGDHVSLVRLGVVGNGDPELRAAAIRLAKRLSEGA